MSLTELRKPRAADYLIRLKSFRNVNKWAPPCTMSRHSTSAERKKGEKKNEKKGRRKKERSKSKAAATMVLEAAPATGGKQQQPR